MKQVLWRTRVLFAFSLAYIIATIEVPVREVIQLWKFMSLKDRYIDSYSSLSRMFKKAWRKEFKE